MTPISSALKGAIAATMLGIYCSQESDGRINFATPFVDDQGVDLLFFEKGGKAKVVLAQVKSIYNSETEAKKRFTAQVQKASFTSRKGYYMMFVAYAATENRLHDTLWLIPSVEFEKELQPQKKDRSFFVLDSSFTSEDMWRNIGSR